MSEPILRCPVCHAGLHVDGPAAACANGHSFDRAREGYLHLLSPGRSRKRSPGDDTDMVTSRRRFLDHGHYRCLSEGLATWVAELAPQTWLDVGCGEGTFTAAMITALGNPAANQQPSSQPDAHYVAFDISRPAVRQAARRCPTMVTAIASVNDMPALDGSVALITSVMSPVLDEEFVRVLAPGGRVLLVTPGASHLAELRAQLYDQYRPHDEQIGLTDGWAVVEQRRFTDQVHLATNQEVTDVWGMTPYRWNAPVEGAARVAALTELEVGVHFVGTLLSKT